MLINAGFGIKSMRQDENVKIIQVANPGVGGRKQKMLDIYSLLGVMFCTNYFMKHFASIFINHLAKGLWKLQIAGV